ncbi:MAG: ABC transporter ATP-binding protein [Pseudomonadota bacterium]
MTEHVLKAQNLTVERGGQKVLSDVSFAIDEGEVFALLGGNGAGKSTTLLTFLGFLAPSSGEAFVQGQKASENTRHVRQQSAYLPESANLYPHLNARENLRYFLSLAGVKRSEAEVEAALDDVSLRNDARGARLETYSKGMRQKVAIALAILREAPILFLDEPTSGLDPVAIDEFNTLITKMSEGGTTVLMVTHDVYGACQVAGRIGLLRRGQFVGAFEAPEGGQISPDEVHAAFAREHQQ